MSALADQPRPDAAAGWGGTGTYRLRGADLRILYEVDDRASTVYIVNVAVAL
jgi:mRNA-degrading endonuclease RelE of RelBE toxin-antitoxin system